MTLRHRQTFTTTISRNPKKAQDLHQASAGASCAAPVLVEAAKALKEATKTGAPAMNKASMKRMPSELFMAVAALGSIKKLAAEGAGLLGGAGAAYAFDRRQTFAAQQRKASEPVSQKERRAREPHQLHLQLQPQEWRRWKARC